jgi:hypothetical protein
MMVLQQMYSWCMMVLQQLYTHVWVGDVEACTANSNMALNADQLRLRGASAIQWIDFCMYVCKSTALHQPVLLAPYDCWHLAASLGQLYAAALVRHQH